MNTDGAEVLMYRIVQQYSDMLFRLAYSRLQTEADAEDCVQDVFMKLLEKQPEFRDQEHEKAWLIRVTINRARNSFLVIERKTALQQPRKSPAETPTKTHTGLKNCNPAPKPTPARKRKARNKAANHSKNPHKKALWYFHKSALFKHY